MNEEHVKNQQENAVLMSLRHVNKRFKMTHTLLDTLMKRPQQRVYAINDLSLDVKQGEILGIVGESGCGKSTLARLMIHLHTADSGEIVLDGKHLDSLHGADLRAARRDVQMIFQDPFASLNPRMTVREILREVLVIHRMRPPGEIDARLLELMDMVGLRHEFLDRLPSQFSGGQRQRIGIARALAMEPKLILADEPVSALDVSIQAQVINLLKELRDRLGLTIVFISHDLGVVRYIADRIVVMYLGRIVEQAEAGTLFAQPLHPYAEALIRATPEINPNRHGIEKPLLEGEPPSPVHLPKGCPFAGRCRFRSDACEEEVPELAAVGADHFVRCIKAIKRDK